ncbi:MAG: sulfurtransferase TusA family protein [Deltaproteobacteria bacterium]|nr:MAG: sulfurtransferase TusA family protein [Deltaproteobacteria bacterium]
MTASKVDECVEAERPARVVDVQGEFCPRPIIETARAVKAVEVGQVVLVLGTDKGIHSDMPAWCRATGHELIDLQEREGIIEVRVRRAH